MKNFAYPISTQPSNTFVAIILTIWLFLPAALVAQQPNAGDQKPFIAVRKDVQAAINTHDKKKLVKAKLAMKDFINNDSNEMQKLACYYMAYADYRLYILFPDITQKQKTQYIDEAIGYLKKSITIDHSFADGQALLGSVYGMKMGVGGAGQIYGPKSDNAMRGALKNGPDNPRVHLLYGIGLLYSPEQYGGGAKRAIKEFKKSSQLFESSQPKNKLMPDWGHAEVYAWLGQAYEKKGQLEEAKTAFEKALQVNPDYGWVKYSLLPALKKKINQ